MFKAEIIADSHNPILNDRLTTFVVTIPRMILSEMNTHRMFTRNSASSRAIPFNKMLKAVKTNPFIPLAWQKDHSGMQGSDYFTGFWLKILVFLWLFASKLAIISSWILNKIGLTKQLCNRILEPFMWHTVIVTASEFENFFALRLNPAAEIHIQKIAELMLDEYNKSKPRFLKDGKWHIPYGDSMDLLQIGQIAEELYGKYTNDNIQLIKVKIAIARCARVSYTIMGEENVVDHRKDIQLCDRLIAMGHYSPTEHVAKVMDEKECFSHFRGQLDDETIQNILGGNLPALKDDERFGWSGNFRGFIQYRKTLNDENRKDSRVQKLGRVVI